MKHLSVLAFLLAGTAAHAQVGEVGLTFGKNSVSDLDGDDASVGFGEFSASYAATLSNGMILNFGVNYRFDDLSSSDDFNSGEDPERRYGVAASALWKTGNATWVGGFLSYGDTRSQDEPGEDEYDVAMIGAEARHAFGEDFLGYMQVGYGEKVREGNDADEGFTKGYALRLGGAYFLNDRTALTFDAEFAGTPMYIDGDDVGRFYSLELGGETWLASAPVAITYGVGYSFVNSTDEGDSAEEFQIGIGAKYVFGASSSRDSWMGGRSIGAPKLPLRASAWTEYLD